MTDEREKRIFDQSGRGEKRKHTHNKPIHFSPVFVCVMLFNFEMEFSTKNVYPKHNNRNIRSWHCIEFIARVFLLLFLLKTTFHF